MKRIAILSAVSSVIACLPAAADDINQINVLTQTEFRQLSEDLGSALSYKAILPAEALGTTGFDVGVEITATRLQHQTAWGRASSGNAPSTVVVPKLHIHKGLPLGFDVGAFYSSIPDSNISLWGAELRYAIVQGGTATPALGVRASYSKLSGVSQLEFDTKALDLTISKGLAMFTPYAGAGRVWTASTPVGAPNLSKEDFGQNKYYVGGNFNLGIVNVAVEADKTGDATSYGAKLGWRF